MTQCDQVLPFFEPPDTTLRTGSLAPGRRLFGHDSVIRPAAGSADMLSLTGRRDSGSHKAEMTAATPSAATKAAVEGATVVTPALPWRLNSSGLFCGVFSYGVENTEMPILIEA